MNKMLVEQMKLMRQQMKHQNKKREKLKTKSKKIYDLQSLKRYNQRKREYMRNQNQ